MSIRSFSIILSLIPLCSLAQNTNVNKFKQLKEEIATPNVYRAASGAPGHEYYQQQADYEISVKLDDEKQTITGKETITYHNNSPDALTYLWIQLDQNMRSRESDTRLISTGKIHDKQSFNSLQKMHNNFDGGFKITSVTDDSGKDLNYIINKTMMRIDLPQTLKPGGTYAMKISWWYNINDRMQIGGRSGYEYFEEDDNYLYTIAQFFPRMAVYNDVEGWQHKQFLGRGEFTLPFGDYEVSITVPADHVVSATGTMQNTGEVLSSAQRHRYEKAKKEYNKPILIITQEEAEQNESSRLKNTKTWEFKANNVRDFAFASSRKFIWDAMSVKVGDNNVLCMSFYPKEGNPLWEQYSTKVVAHTIKTYSKYTIDYPYPVAQSIHAKWIGMEYPMICFNGGRPEKDGTYSKGTKYAMIGVIIHEVGHNFFPMIINSDERQWTWMDEGLNTFVQYLTEQEFEPNYPSRRGPAYKIVDYMSGDKSRISPIMTNSESIHQFGNNAYGKPATALNILRETVMGRELFDYSFKTYCERWAFKHPTPEDFFRTMEDASAVDLDWYWRGWFYTNDHVDISIEDVKWFQVDTKDPSFENEKTKELEAKKPKFIGDQRNQELITYMSKDSTLADFYTSFDPLKVTPLDVQEFYDYFDKLDENERELLCSIFEYYEVDLKCRGGLVMPVILEFEFYDGETELIRIPAEIWKLNSEEVSKVFFFEKPVKSVTLDPYLETADVDVNNNYWPRQMLPSRFELYKGSQSRWQTRGQNPMQKYRQFYRKDEGERLQQEPK